MKTARTKIDVFKGTLTMEFDGEVIDFNIFETMRFPNDDHSCFSIDILDSLAQAHLDQLREDALETVLTNGIEVMDQVATTIAPYGTHMQYHAMAFDDEVIETVAALESLPRPNDKSPSPMSIPISTNKLLPSI